MMKYVVLFVFYAAVFYGLVEASMSLLCQCVLDH